MHCPSTMNIKLRDIGCHNKRFVFFSVDNIDCGDQKHRIAGTGTQTERENKTIY